MTPATATSAVLAALDRRVDDVERAVHAKEYWRLITSPTADRHEFRRLFAEVFLRIAWYQPITTEAGFHMIGRLPKTEHRLIKALCGHKAEEAEHGLWAVRDFLRVGGDGSRLRESMSPSSFAVTAVWWRMAMSENPFGYLGAEYLFEELTARLTKSLAPLLQTRSDSDGFGFVIAHAAEDEKHASLLRRWIDLAVANHPESAEAIVRCFDFFRSVYPLPLWAEAYGAVKANVT
jgi:hypothetical protein